MLSPLPRPHRDPTVLLEAARRECRRRGALWVFGYASLIWRPEFDAAEQRRAVVHGWHRALRMRSRVNRGTPECPGLVFALVRGGSCHGFVYRVAAQRLEHELERLWQREMPNAIYDPRWLPCRTAAGPVEALAFTLDRTSPAHVGELADSELVEILRRASGRCGTTLQYVLETAHCLERHGIRDREVRRMLQLAQAHGLHAPVAAAAAADVQARPTEA